MNPEVAHHSMTRRARKNLPQAHLSRLVMKMDKSYYQDHYKAAFKAATVAGNIPKSEKGKHGTGVDAICERINKEMLMSPSDRKLVPSTVHRAMQRGEFGISPPMAGRKSTLPSRRLHCFSWEGCNGVFESRRLFPMFILKLDIISINS
jgi:hypothetical protein